MTIAGMSEENLVELISAYYSHYDQSGGNANKPEIQKFVEIVREDLAQKLNNVHTGQDIKNLIQFYEEVMQSARKSHVDQNNDLVIFFGSITHFHLTYGFLHFVDYQEFDNYPRAKFKDVLQETLENVEYRVERDLAELESSERIKMLSHQKRDELYPRFCQGYKLELDENIVMKIEQERTMEELEQRKAVLNKCSSQEISFGSRSRSSGL